MSAEAASAARRRVLLASAGGFLGFYLELSAVPYLAARHGGQFAAGLLTFALMVSTVAAQAVTPLLLRRFDAGAVLSGGLLLLGGSTLLYCLSESVANLISVTLVRGAGFGLLTVIGSALTAAYTPSASRGSALGAYGVAGSIGAVFAPALGVAIIRSSPTAIFALGAVPPLLGGLALIPRLPAAAEIHGTPTVGSRAARARVFAALVVVFAVVAAAIGAAFTFVPLLRVGSEPVLLVLFGTGFTVGRLFGGRLLDHDRTPATLLLGLLIGVVAGLALLGIPTFAVAACGAALSGVSIGGVSTATLVMMMDRSGAGGVARASVIWNMTYDVGIAFGAVAFGVIASLLGAGAMFVVAAGAAACVAVPAAAFDWRHVRPGLPSRS